MHSSSGPATAWYRQFWPWFLIALPATVVVAGLWTLVIANQHADDLVVDEYYKEGLAINRQLVRQKRAEELGISGSVTATASGTLRATIAGPVVAGELRLTLSHPMEAERDLTMPLRRVAEGVFTSALPEGLEGRWHWIIDAGDASEWRLDGNHRF